MEKNNVQVDSLKEIVLKKENEVNEAKTSRVQMKEKVMKYNILLIGKNSLIKEKQIIWDQLALGVTNSEAIWIMFKKKIKNIFSKYFIQTLVIGFGHQSQANTCVKKKQGGL